MTSAHQPPLLDHDSSVTLGPTSPFLVSDLGRLGRRFGDRRVTYVGPNFLRLFGNTWVDARPQRTIRYTVLGKWANDEAVEAVAGPPASLADLFAVLALGDDGPGRFSGESNTVYQDADGARWTPHFYTRGTRLGFGALKFGDEVGWEPGDVFLSAVPGLPAESPGVAAQPVTQPS